MDGETFHAGGEKLDVLDMAATVGDNGTLRVALVNRHPDAALHTVNGPDKDSYNSIECPDAVSACCRALTPENGKLALILEPHSVNVLVWEKEKA